MDQDRDREYSIESAIGCVACAAKGAEGLVEMILADHLKKLCDIQAKLLSDKESESEAVPKENAMKISIRLPEPDDAISSLAESIANAPAFHRAIERAYGLKRQGR